MSYYPVYLVESMGNQRDHHAIFIATKKDESGTLFHVKGNIQNGMEYETKQTPQKPDASHSFISKSQLGWVKTQDVHRVDPICRSNPPPEKQFDGPRRIHKERPLRRCQEWTSETIHNLRAVGVLMSMETVSRVKEGCQ